VPTIYGGLDDETALAEALLRGVTALAAGGRRRLFRVEVEGLDLVTIASQRELRLVRLHGAGLSRLDLLREDIVDCPESEYDYTADWARSLWGCPKRPHGIAWTSRQNDSGRALMLWGGGRVDSNWLSVVDGPVHLDSEPGLDLVRRACADAGIDFEG